MNQLPTARRDRRPSPHQDGFTLIEIMVVIVILGLLATLVVPNVIKSGDDARIQKAKTDAVAIASAAKLYRAQVGRVPTIEDLTTPDAKGQPYIEDIARDPWDNDYIIRPDDNRNFEVISMGPDGTEGTEDDISSKNKQKEN